MEKDNFESLLRTKVLQAELSLNQNSNKEGVWNAIQKKRQPQRKFYYAAAAILFILGTVSVFYLKEDKTTAMLTKLKVKQKPMATEQPKPQILAREKIIKNAEVPLKVTPTEQTIVIKVREKQEIIPALKVDEAISSVTLSTDIENKVVSVANPKEVPEFTVQFKRGTSTVNRTDEGLIYTAFKKFKLKRDTTYFASAQEKQPTKMKLSFKKEN